MATSAQRRIQIKEVRRFGSQRAPYPIPDLTQIQTRCEGNLASNLLIEGGVAAGDSAKFRLANQAIAEVRLQPQTVSAKESGELNLPPRRNLPGIAGDE